MTVFIVNPNSTASMTDAMTARARETVPMLTWRGVTSHDGPPAIQGAADGAAAEGPLLRLVERIAADGAEAIVIGCFDDTGLAGAKAVVSCPVIGIGDASYQITRLMGLRFSVVTTTLASVPVIEGNFEAQRFAEDLGRVRASGVEVLDLERKLGGAFQKIEAEAARALLEDDVSCLVAGCGGMVAVTNHLRRSLPCRIIDPIEAAAKIVFAVV